MFFNNQLNKFVFELPDDDPNKATAEYIIDGYDEAVKKGYKFGLTDYARMRYIDYTLSTMFGITGYSNMFGMQPSDTATALQPGTTEGTQTGTKVDETQTIVGSEDVGAISAKQAEGETAKEAIEKTEKVSVPKSTVNIGTGDSAPAPSELNQNAPGLQLANDGMLYSRGKAVKMFAPLEREIEEASAIAFQIKASDLPEEVKQERLEDLRQDFLQTIAGFGITEYKLQF